jgi:ATP synthase I chain
MMTDSDPASNLTGGITDDDLQQMLRRALRTVAILAVLLFVAFTLTMGWQSGLLELAGGVISWSGIREWRSLARAVSSTLNPQQAPHPMGRTLVMFFLRLAVVAAILYVSLRCLNGSVYALVAGIALAVVALSIEAVRLLRN